MWLGEQITSRGIGNGMSLLILAGIVVGLPRAASDLYDKVFISRFSWNFFVLLILLAFMFHGPRGLSWWSARKGASPSEYAKRVVGRKGIRAAYPHICR